MYTYTIAHCCATLLVLVALISTAADAFSFGNVMPGVVDLTEQTLNETIGKDRAVFVAFYTTWCVKCPNAAEEMMRLAVAYDNSANAQHRLVLGKVNAEAERNLTRRLKIEAYPTFLFFPVRSRYEHTYRGWFNADGFVAYLQNRMSQLNLTLPPARGALREVTESDFDAVVHNGAKDVVLLIEGNDCVRCAKAHDTMSTLAKIFQNDDERIAFAAINVTTAGNWSKVNRHYKIKHLPVILYVIKGKVGAGARYRNERSLAKLLNFVNTMSGLQRTLRGDRVSSYGVHDELLQLLRKGVRDKDASALEQLKDEAFITAADTTAAEYYVHLAEQHAQASLDKEYVEHQISRLQRMLLSIPRGKIYDTINTRLNILHAAKRTLFAP